MANVTVTVRTVDDQGVPVIIDGVLVRVFDAPGDTYITEGTTGSVTPGEVDFTLFGNAGGVDYTLVLSKSGVSFPPAPSKIITVKDPPAPSNVFQFTGHVGLVGQLVKFVVKDDQGTPQPVEGVAIRVFDSADAFLTELETDTAGEASLVLEGVADPGTQYITRLTAPTGYAVQNGPTQTVGVHDPLVPPATNIFDFVMEALPSIPVSPDPDMCRLSGYFIDPSKRPLKNLSLIFHPREGYPDPVLGGAPYSGEPTVITGRIVASERRINTDKDGYVEFDMPRKGVFDVYAQGLDAGDTSLLACVYVPDAAGAEIQGVLFPYITKVTYDDVAVAVAVDGTAELGFAVESSNLLDPSSLLATVPALLNFFVDDEAVAGVEVGGDGKLLTSGLSAGTATISVERKVGTTAPRRPELAAVEALASEPVVTVS
jgi:hypothetical protein